MTKFMLFSGIGGLNLHVQKLMAKIEELPDFGEFDPPKIENVSEGFRTFYFNETPVRVKDINGEPWFVGKDVATALGYSNSPKAMRDHVDDEDKLTERIVISGQRRRVVVINESGMYSLTLQSQLGEAKKFKRWVTHEVIPTIRKTGGYGKQMPDFIQRYLLNFGQVPSTHFSVISELFCTVYGAFESAGHRLADRALDGVRLRPDVSAGRCFSDFLKARGYDERDGRIEYDHKFPDGYSVRAYAYPNKLLGVFRDFVYGEWLPKRASIYLKSRDPKAIQYLPKLLQ